ncbi:MAG: biotin--[acetyl-CoA-carboxylase] ligase, partial [Pirellulaceae bacterium]|nr:biotin--[acetyl-CoA-carboxylase] ligase [Pirellulaceae bacterium]
MMAAYKLIILSEVDSTNSFVHERAAMLDDRSVIVANRQSSGRGRNGRAWYTDEAGGLALSILLKDGQLLKTHAANVPGLTQLAAVLLCRACAGLGVAAIIKWPNDVLVGDRKLAGILAEAKAGSDGIEALIIGIGVNLNTKPADLAR